MFDFQEEKTKSFSHKNKKIELCPLSFKLLVVKHAKMLSVGADERKSGVDKKKRETGYKMRAKYKIKLVQKMEGVL